MRWGVAGNIAIAWVLTLLGAGLFGAGAYWLASAFGTGVLGPPLISIMALGALMTVLAARRRDVAEAAST